MNDNNEAVMDAEAGQNDAKSYASSDDGFEEEDEYSASISNDTGVSPTSGFSEMDDTRTAGKDSITNIAEKEQRAVLVFKIVIVMVMIMITLGIAVAVYFYLDLTEAEQFEEGFEEASLAVFSSLGDGLAAKIGSIDAFAVGLVSYARDAKMQWPFVTIPDHAIRSSKALGLTRAIAIEQYHVVRGDDQRSQWETFALLEEDWVQQGIDVQRDDPHFHGRNVSDYVNGSQTKIHFNGKAAESRQGPYTPSWQAYPVLPEEDIPAYSWNAIQDELLGSSINTSLSAHKAVVSPVLNLEDQEKNGSDADEIAKWTDWTASRIHSSEDATEPIVSMMYPVLDTAADSSVTKDTEASATVAVVGATFFWKTFLENLLQEGNDGLTVVLHNACGQLFTYKLIRSEAVYLGPGDAHDAKYDNLEMTTTLADIVLQTNKTEYYSGLPLDFEHCSYTLTTYPSQEMESNYKTNQPFLFALMSVVIFAFTAIVFLTYDKLQGTQQKKVMDTAAKSNAIVASLFPSNVRDRLMADEAGVHSYKPTKTKLKSFLSDGDLEQNGTGSSMPIADLFPECTVMFADIAGFTAWSSTREPGQVFTLLETVYGAFDNIAVKRNVFKVETIGDSYVAVAGLPEARKDHAAVMVKFARDCRENFTEISHRLEVTLGPDTGDLRMRFGLHSGPVTAGVLRGQKSRFQLFGDTVNTAARMESHGKVNKIQVSQATADLLIKAKKESWLHARQDKVEAKGKGLLQTYFAEPGGGVLSISTHSGQTVAGLVDTKTSRLVNWNVDVLSKMLAKVIASRSKNINSNHRVQWANGNTKNVLKEVKEVIELPEFEASKAAGAPTVLNCNVRSQLKEYVTSIALTYHENPFHNFEHASHVCMSTAKLLSRIIAPDQVCGESGDVKTLQSTMHDHTYGIANDPLTQFACVFSALIHDSDHPGVPNVQLVKEETETAKLYLGQSVAEQNSVNLAWSLLLEEKYSDLRSAICQTQDEQNRFRQLVVNGVMATDIMDKSLKSLREARWETAFSEEPKQESAKVTVDRKATIVIEHLIQASDVAHTMQHWHIYRKWNERLFREMHEAYLDGRAEKGPGMNWYYGELGFFDFYIIPLAKKLSKCGVFGVSSDEYLNYAMMNRNEWEKKGREVVKGYMENLENDTVKVVDHHSGVSVEEEEAALEKIKQNVDMDIVVDSSTENSSSSNVTSMESCHD